MRKKKANEKNITSYQSKANGKKDIIVKKTLHEGPSNIRINKQFLGFISCCWCACEHIKSRYINNRQGKKKFQIKIHTRLIILKI